MNFSVVLIARNEALTLPRLVSSLAEFQRRGGEIVLVDTGSTDGTPDIARNLGCNVSEVGTRFLHSVSDPSALNAHFVETGEPAIVQPGATWFDYAAARNFAATLSPTDMIATPDCDEQYTALDLDAIEAAIADGVQQLEYHFVFSHLPTGEPDVQFAHSKFYDRRALHWTGVVHEVLTGVAQRQWVPFIRLEHWQNPSTNRGGYLTGLAIDCHQHPGNDRNSHYLGRELLWSGRPKSSIKELSRHVAMNRWPAERAQSLIYIGDAHASLGDTPAALAAYRKAIVTDPTRRQAFIRLAEHFYKQNDHLQCAQNAAAAVVTPLHAFYGNQARDYGLFPHEMLYWALYRLGAIDGAAHHWRICHEADPSNPKYAADWQFFNRGPSVSIVIPTLGRDSELKSLVDSIAALAGYPVEVIVQHDSFENRKGVARTLSAGVTRASGDLILFLGNDCLPEPSFVAQAVIEFCRAFPDRDGLVALNDGLWDGKLATHWLASRSLLPSLGGEFLSHAYNHVGCDNELTARVRALGKYAYAPLARIRHAVIEDPVRRIAWDPVSVADDRAHLADRLRLLGFTDPVAA